MARKHAAFAVAALGGATLSAAAGAMLFWLVAVLSRHPEPTGPSLFVFVYALAINLIASFTFGLGWHTFARRKGWVHAYVYWLPAAAAGTAICLATTSITLALFGEVDLGVLGELATIGLYGGIVGAMTGLFAWLIRRPDRDQPSAPKATSA